MTGIATALARPARRLAGVAGLLTAAAVVTACTGGGTSAGKGMGATPVAAASGSAALALQEQYEKVVRIVLPAVVQITASQGVGSGVAYDHSGDVVTNAHVVGSATRVKVRGATSSTELPAKVLGVFAADDLAVIRVEQDASSLRPATFAKSADVKVGEMVLAMGNPLGLTGTVTEGIVSATGRNVSEGQGSSAAIISAIQTSAAINPGNSGGALVDLAGRVVGIPTLGATNPSQGGGAASGIGFAIPSDTVNRIAPQLISHGRVTNSGRAALGISAETVANASGQPTGVGVANVTPGEGADKAGIKPGDIITAVDGQATKSVEELTSILVSKRPGDTVTVHYTRDGKSRTATVTLSNLTS